MPEADGPFRLTRFSVLSASRSLGLRPPSGCAFGMDLAPSGSYRSAATIIRHPSPHPPHRGYAGEYRIAHGHALDLHGAPGAATSPHVQPASGSKYWGAEVAGSTGGSVAASRASLLREDLERRARLAGDDAESRWRQERCKGVSGDLDNGTSSCVEHVGDHSSQRDDDVSLCKDDPRWCASDPDRLGQDAGARA